MRKSGCGDFMKNWIFWKGVRVEKSDVDKGTGKEVARVLRGQCHKPVVDKQPTLGTSTLMIVPQYLSTARTIANACAEDGIRSKARIVKLVVEPEVFAKAG